MTTPRFKADEILKSLAGMTESELKTSKKKYEKANVDLNKEIAELQSSIKDTKATGFDVSHIEEEKQKILTAIDDLNKKIDQQRTELDSNKMIIKGIDKLVDDAKNVKTRDEIFKLLKSAGLLDVQKLKTRLNI